MKRLKNLMNIVLIGMRGSGKTTVARLLSQKLKKEYIEMDEMVVQKLGMSIPKIVEKHGWNYFRDVESEITKEVSQKDNKIISTGGGVILRSQNVEALKKNSKLFWLKADVDTLLQRIEDDPNRPALTNKQSQKEEIEEILKQRESLYHKAADFIIETEGKTVEEVIENIIENL